MNRQRNYSGFTLIEILVVVGLIAILAAITIVAINPAKNFESTRNTQRSSDISAILNAVTQYTSESGQTLAGLITAAGLITVIVMGERGLLSAAPVGTICHGNTLKIVI